MLYSTDVVIYHRPLTRLSEQGSVSSRATTPLQDLTNPSPAGSRSSSPTDDGNSSEDTPVQDPPGSSSLESPQLQEQLQGPSPMAIVSPQESVSSNGPDPLQDLPSPSPVGVPSSAQDGLCETRLPDIGALGSQASPPSSIRGSSETSDMVISPPSSIMPSDAGEGFTTAYSSSSAILSLLQPFVQEGHTLWLKCPDHGEQWSSVIHAYLQFELRFERSRQVSSILR